MKLELSKHVLFEDSVSSSRCSFLPCKWFPLFCLGCWPRQRWGVAGVVVPATEWEHFCSLGSL